MIFKKFSILLHTIILSVILVSCESDFFKSNNREENDLFSVEEAESIFNRNDGGIRLPVFKDAPTKSIETDNSSIDWSKAESKEFMDFYAVSIPMEVPDYASILMLGSSLGEMERGGEMDAKSSLVLQKIKQDGSVLQFVVTIIGFKTDTAINEENDSYSYLGNRSNFTGYYIISTLDGRIENFYIYENGVRISCSISYSVNLSKMQAGEKCIVFLGDDLIKRTKSSGNVCRVCGFEGIVYTDVGICLACGYAFDLPGITVTPGECPYCGRDFCACSFSRRGSGSDDHGREETPIGCESCGRRPCICGGGGTNIGGSGGGGDQTTYNSGHSNYIKYDSKKTKDMFEDAIKQLKNKAYKISRLMDYVEKKGEKITIKEYKGTPKSDFTYLYSPTNCNTIWHRALAVEADKVGHELAHFWFKHEYPSINLTNNLNSELISTLAELVYSIDTYNGKYYLMSQFDTDDIKKIIKVFWDNPNSENLDKYLKVFKDKRTKYNNFVFDRGSFLEQVENFKNLFR